MFEAIFRKTEANLLGLHETSGKPVLDTRKKTCDHGFADPIRRAFYPAMEKKIRSGQSVPKADPIREKNGYPNISVFIRITLKKSNLGLTRYNVVYISNIYISNISILLIKK